VKEKLIQVAVDLRRLLPPGTERGICNLSGALDPEIFYRPGETFAETLAQVSSQMEYWKGRQPGMTGALLLELAMAQGYRRAKRMISRTTSAESEGVNPLLFSNLGLLDAERLDFGGVPAREAFVLGPVMFGHGLMLTASTYAWRMTLALRYCQGTIRQDVNCSSLLSTRSA